MPAVTETIVITVAQLKGGGGKSTTAGHVAQALHERGARVLAVDADPQKTLYDWQQDAALPWPCILLPSGKLHRELPGIVGDHFDVVVIDTPGTEHGRGVALSAVRAATHVFVPMAPTSPDYRRMPDVRSLLDEATELDAEFEHGVLLIAVDARTLSEGYYRGKLAADGWHVMRSVIPSREHLKQSVGAPILRASMVPFADAVEELLEMER